MPNNKNLSKRIRKRASPVNKKRKSQRNKPKKSPIKKNICKCAKLNRTCGCTKKRCICKPKCNC